MKVTVHFTIIKPTRDELSPATLTKLSSTHKILRTAVVEGFITAEIDLLPGASFYMLAESLVSENGTQREITSSSILSVRRQSRSEYLVETIYSTYKVEYNYFQ